MHFGENQLSPSLLGLSPLTTGHPPSFQPWWVRPSTRSYPRFSLPMDRSLGFGSTACDSTPVSDSLWLRLPLSGVCSPFPHGTRSLSVARLYLALRGGPRRFTPAFPDPALLGNTTRRS